MVRGYNQVMGPQLPVPIDRLVLIWPTRVICFTFIKHWVQECTLNLSGFCQSYEVDSMRNVMRFALTGAGFCCCHSLGDFTAVVLL